VERGQDGRALQNEDDMTTEHKFNIELDDRHSLTLDDCARLEGTSALHLVRRLILEHLEKKGKEARKFVIAEWKARMKREGKPWK
jgi:hypothetical protein